MILIGVENLLLDKPLKVEEAASQINREPQAVTNWAKRGYITSASGSTSGPGRGRERVFGYDEIGTIHLIDQLARSGMTIADAANCARNWHDIVLHDGERVYLVIYHSPSHENSDEGMAWSRVMPESEVFNRSGLEDYSEMHPRAITERGVRMSLFDLTTFCENLNKRLFNNLQAENA